MILPFIVPRTCIPKRCPVKHKPAKEIYEDEVHQGLKRNARQLGRVWWPLGFAVANVVCADGSEVWRIFEYRAARMARNSTPSPILKPPGAVLRRLRGARCRNCAESSDV